MTILTLTPRGDYAADTVAQWGTQALRNANHTPYYGSQINVTMLRAAVGMATFILYFGHGLPDRWIECASTGNVLPTVVRTIVEVPDADCLDRAVVFAFACESGDKLGPAAVAAGAHRYIGFQKTIFWLPRMEGEEAVLAATVGELVQVVLNRGASVTIADLRTPIRARYQYFLSEASRGNPDAGHIANVLAILMDALTLH
jgi:hypothetical protein